MTFEELNLHPDLLDGLASMGFSETTPIQEAAIPVVLEGKDLIACAQTGTGKTAAYLVPVIEKLMDYQPGKSRALVLAPTRELAHQIDQNFQAISYFTGTSSVAIYGGKDSKNWDKQKYAIEQGVDVLVATPGRFLLHLTLGYLDLSNIEIVILDEADKMLDMGFHPDIIRIINQVPENRQTIMFSATMPKKIRVLAKEIQKDPAEINFNLAKPAEGINQQAYCVYDDQKLPLLKHIIDSREIDSMIIFASSKAKVDEIDRALRKMGVAVKAMHSDKEQEERTRTLQEFKSKQFKVIVGTDVLARGIDIDNLSHVLNFDCPKDAEDYVHRVGRTARASKTGEAITLVNPRDFRRLAGIERLIETSIPKPEMPDFLGETPEYNPGKGGGGRDGGRGRGGDSRRGSKGGPKGGGSRREGPKSGGGPRNHHHGEGGGGQPKKRRKRGGRKRGGKGKGAGSQDNAPASGGQSANQAS